MKYQFVGEGDGVPGLPHVISDEEAARLGLGEMLRAAIENGNYRAVSNEGEGVLREEIASSLRSSQRRAKGKEVNDD